MENFDIRKFHLQCEYKSLENKCKKLAKADNWKEFNKIQAKMEKIEQLLSK